MSNLPDPFLTPAPLWFYTPAAGGAIRLIPRWEVESKIVSEAMRDADFRNQLIDNPRMAIEQRMGTTLPANVTIEIMTVQAGEFVFVLPSKPDRQNWTELALVADDMLPYTALTRGPEPRMPRLDLQIYVALVTRAWTDEQFRTQLLTQPRSTIGALYGPCFEPDTEIIAVAETSDRIFLLLPAAEAEEEELVPGLSTANLNPIFVEVLQSPIEMTFTGLAQLCATLVPLCQPPFDPTRRIAGCPYEACTGIFTT
jgi:hypothetical protein